MRKLNKNHPMMEMARRAKRAGMAVEKLTENLKPEYQGLAPQIEAEYERFKPRKKY